MESGFLSGDPAPLYVKEIPKRGRVVAIVGYNIMQASFSTLLRRFSRSISQTVAHTHSLLQTATKQSLRPLRSLNYPFPLPNLLEQLSLLCHHHLLIRASLPFCHNVRNKIDSMLTHSPFLLFLRFLPFFLPTTLFSLETRSSYPLLLSNPLSIFKQAHH